MSESGAKNLPVVICLGLLLAAMTTLVAFSVPLYRLFCAATGYGNTIERSATYLGPPSSRMVTVRFEANLSPSLPWRFRPAQPEVKVRLGEGRLVFFSAENLSDQPIVGHATFNVTPSKAGVYFKKIQCFCFDDEKLRAREKVEMPVEFFVDPALDKDADATDVDTITLSYTFFRSTNPAGAKDLARYDAEAAADPERGKELFAQRCAACHSLDVNALGPTLNAVLGRAAGSQPGYDYSPALRASRVVWSRDALDRWLANPRDVVPDARMPVRVLEPTARRDIIAFLATHAANASVANTK